MRISLVDPIPPSLREIPGGTVAATFGGGVLAYDWNGRPYRVDEGGVAPLDYAETRHAVADALHEAGNLIWASEYVHCMSEAFLVDRWRLTTVRSLYDCLHPGFLRAVADIACRSDAKDFGRLFAAAGRISQGMVNGAGYDVRAVGDILHEGVDVFFDVRANVGQRFGGEPLVAEPGAGEPVAWVSLVKPYPGDAGREFGLEPVGTCEGGILAYDGERNPYRVTGNGVTPLDTDQVNHALPQALDDVCHKLWPQGWVVPLSRVVGIDRRALTPSRIQKKGIPLRVARFVGEISGHSDAFEFGEALVAVASVQERTQAGPEAMHDLVDDVLDSHLAWMSGPVRPFMGPGGAWTDVGHGIGEPEAGDGPAPRM